MMRPFSPIGNNTSVTTVAATPTAATLLPGPANSVAASAAVHNSGSAVAFIRFGDNAVSSAATDAVLPPNSLIIFSLPPVATHYSVFSATASMLVYVQRGGGA